MRRTAVAVTTIVLSLVVAACGGEGASSQEIAVPNQPAAKPLQNEKKPSAKQLAQQEKRKEEKNKKLLEEEEDRVIAEEKQREAAEEEAALDPKKHHHTSKHEPEPDEGATGPVADPIAVEEFEGFATEPDHSNWEIAYGVCAVTPEKQMAKEFHTEQNWGAIGHAYGNGYSEPFNVAPEEGCMVALKDNRAQREAMFAVMEDDE